MRRRIAVLLVVAGAGTASAAAQQRNLALSKPEAAFPEPFTAIRGVREMPDGRALVSDLRDKLVMLVDFSSGSAERIGREGQGPQEYALPGTLFPLPRGETLLQDLGNRRFLTIRADGSVGGTLSPPPPPAHASDGARPGGFGLVVALLEAHGVDAMGRLYFQGIPAPTGETSPDSLPIMRWDRAGTAIDTIAWIPVTEDMRPRVTRQGSNAFMMRIGSNRAWPRQLQWVVAPDGRIAMVSPEPYRVTWLGPRGATEGPVVPYQPIEVTEAEKRAYREQMARVTPIMMAFGDGGRRAAPPPPRPNTEEPEWPETLPPFSGRDAVLLTPEGEVWVQRLHRASDPTPRYDVFDSAGRLTGQVTLPPRSRVVGFGKGTVYVVRMDEDDLQYLERYRK
jgi:hypothetical protein